MTRKEVFDEINKTQDEYVSQLIALINNPDYSSMKTISFTSPTGTGKTKMMAKLMNFFNDCYFIVTTLSKGQLNIQVRTALQNECNQDNFYVYGSADYKINSILDSEDIIGRIPENTKCIWIRDEGHIKTNRYEELLMNYCYKVINFSATNVRSDIHCNFSHTMMLRTVNQNTGTPEDAIKKLLEVKKVHKCVKGYNPCAIVRCIGGKNDVYKEVVRLCKKYKLKTIDITEDAYVMAELCEDDNEYDVIINKLKITEGIDIRRAHVLYMDNQPTNNTTTIQAIGRCRRNALIYREDIDIFDPKNKELLDHTRECFVYYNVQNMRIDSDEDGELYYAFCNHISCEDLKPNTKIYVENGQLTNGLYVIELDNKTGWFTIEIDKNTGFNVVNPITDFYERTIEKYNNFVYVSGGSLFEQFRKVLYEDIQKFPLHDTERQYIISEEGKVIVHVEKTEPYYMLQKEVYKYDVPGEIAKVVLQRYKNKKREFNKQLERLEERTLAFSLDQSVLPDLEESLIKKRVDDYIDDQKRARNLEQREFNRLLNELAEISIDVYDRDFNSRRVCLKVLKGVSSYIITLIKYCCILIYEEESKGTIENRVRDLIRNLAHSNQNWNRERLAKIIYRYMLDKEFRDGFNHLVYSSDTQEILKDFNRIKLLGHASYNEDAMLYIDDVDTFFGEIENVFFYRYTYIDIQEVGGLLNDFVNIIEEKLKKGVIDCVKYSCDGLLKKVSEGEYYLLKTAKMYRPVYCIKEKELPDYFRYKEYEKIANDRESAIVGVDVMKQVDLDYGKNNAKDEKHRVVWTESRTVTSKVGRFTKLNSYISRRYSDELIRAKKQYFTGKNDFDLDKKTNSMIGYCVEYYSKYLVYGRNYLSNQFEKDRVYRYNPNKYEVVHACMLKYKEMMALTFGSGVAKVIRIMSLEELSKEKNAKFVQLIVDLGKRTANYVKKTLYPDSTPVNNIDPNLSIRHIAGMADYITEDTILDVKVRNNINENCLRQVLAYHYLSKKRSDLHIKRVIVYDATSDRAVVVDLKTDQSDDPLSVTGAEYLFLDLFKHADISFIPVDVNRIVEKAISTLDYYGQSIISLYYFRNNTVQEIAEKNNCSEEKVIQVLDYSKAYLKFILYETYLYRASGELW